MGNITLTKLGLLIIVFLLLFSSVVSAESGTLYSAVYTQRQQTELAVGLDNQVGYQGFNLTTAEISACNGLQTVLFQWPNSASILNGGGSPASASTEFSSEYGSGMIGYQLLYTPLGAYAGGYLYAQFDNPINVGLATGKKEILLTFNGNAIHYANFTQSFTTNDISSVVDSAGAKMMAFNISIPKVSLRYLTSRTASTTINYNNVNHIFANTYDVNLGGLGAVGSVGKLYNGGSYPSQVYVFKSDGSTIQANEPALSLSNFTFNVLNYPLYISVKDALGYWYNTSLLLEGMGGSEYTIYNVPQNITPNQNVTLTYSPQAASNIEFIAIDILNTNGQEIDLESTDGYFTQPFSYQKLGNGTWFGYNRTSSSYNILRGAIAPTTFGFTFTKTGTYKEELRLIDSNGYTHYSMAGIVVSEPVGAHSLSVYPVDYQSGAIVINARIGVKNYANNLWLNRTILTPSDCIFKVNDGIYGVQVLPPTGSTYTSANTGIQVAQVDGADVELSVPLIKNQSGIAPANSTVVLFKVTGYPDNLPIYNAIVTAPSIGFIGNTKTSGVVQFNATTGQPITVNAQAGGYNEASIEITPEGIQDYYTIILEPSTIITYITTQPTPTPTNAPVVTPTKWGRNYTCGSTNDTTLLGGIRNGIACAGVEGGQDQSIALALVITVLCILCVGAVTKGKPLGVAFGGIVGFIFSLMLGLIPTWALIALVILSCGAVAIAVILKQ